MKLIIDDAHVDAIRHIYEYYPVSGVTTNPSILAKAGRDPLELLREIRSIVGPDGELHAQAVSRDAAGIIEEAHSIAKAVGENTFIKIPAVEEGFKAMKILHAEGFNITATVVYSPMQAVLSGMCGANYAAPYVNRIDNLGYNGAQVANDIHDILQKNGIPCAVLGASFKNCNQVLELVRHGVEAVTVSPDIIEKLAKNYEVDHAVDAFIEDFEKLAGKDAKMLFE